MSRGGARPASDPPGCATLAPSPVGEGCKMDLSDLIDRNAAFTPDKPAIRFDGAALTYAAFAERIAAAARALKSQLGVGARRPRRDPRRQSSRLSGAALRLRAARRDAGAAQLAARGARAGVHPVRRVGEGAGGRGGFAAVIAPLKQALPDVRIVGLDFAPEGARSTICSPRAAATAAIRSRSLRAAADRLHLRHHRPSERRGAAPGGAASGTP